MSAFRLLFLITLVWVAISTTSAATSTHENGVQIIRLLDSCKNIAHPSEIQKAHIDFIRSTLKKIQIDLDTIHIQHIQHSPHQDVRNILSSLLADNYDLKLDTSNQKILNSLPSNEKAQIRTIGSIAMAIHHLDDEFVWILKTFKKNSVDLTIPQLKKDIHQLFVDLHSLALSKDKSFITRINEFLKVIN